MFGITEFMDKKLYPDFENSWDNVLFRNEILSNIKPEYNCLDYGAGRGSLPQMNFKGLVSFMAGVDLEETVLTNPYLDEAKQINLESNTIPYKDNTFDFIFSNNVMEHVNDPEVTLKEIHRVLKPGGVFLVKTPNKLHYMPLIASITPNWFHVYYNGLRGRKEIDTFPTRYKLNTQSSIEKHAKSSNLNTQCIKYIEGRPEYLRILAATYLVGFLYERIVNSTEKLEKIRCVLIFNLKKH